MAQALHLANGTTINEKLRMESGAVARALAANQTDSEVLDHLFLAALARRPTDAERSRLLAILADAVREAGDDAKARAAARRQAVEDLYWATLTGKEFLFNH
jgi:hypothetical protein